MKERGWIEPIVERVVGQVLDSHAAQLRTEIVRRVMEEIAAEPATDQSPPTMRLPRPLQRIWRARLPKSSWEPLNGRFCARCSIPAPAMHARVALFVVKGSHATGWQARGFANSDAVKDFALDESAPAVPVRSAIASWRARRLPTWTRVSCRNLERQRAEKAGFSP